MKKVIDGLVYNTDTAIEIASWDNGLSTTDFNNCEETLYKTKNGKFFVYGEGGALTRWSESYGNSRYGGKGIITLVQEEALMWCEDHSVDADIISQYFSIDEA